VAKHASVDSYIDALPDHLRPIAQATRAAIDDAFPAGTAAIRWAHPTWSLGKTPVCYVKAASQHLTFGFWKGASLLDPSGRLETSGQVLAHVKLRSLHDVDPRLFAVWIEQAVQLEQPG
jgi:hypothetical protein